MKNDYTHLAIVLDRSGSMSVVRDATLEGLNRLIVDQKKVPGKCTLTLIQFDHNLGAVNTHASFENADIQFIGAFTDYQPRGGTPLYDAIAHVISGTGKFLKSMPESERPAKVICAIVTDGLENSSVTHTREAVFAMIKHQQETYKWEFLFIGANQDAYAVGAGIGIAMSHAINYAANDAGTNAVYTSMSNNVKMARMAVAAGETGCTGWSAEDRRKQDDAK